MISVFLKNGFIYTLATVLTRGIAIFLIPIYTRYLTPSEYGIIDYFIILSSIINLTIALEISQAVVRYYQEAKTFEEKKAYVSTAFNFTVFMSIMYLLVSIYFAEELTLLLLDDISLVFTFILASAAISTSIIFNFVQNQLKFEIKPKEFAIVSVLNILFLAFTAIYLLVFTNLKIESIFIAQIIANIVSSLLAIYFSKSNYGLTFVYYKFKEMISFSIPLIFSSVAVFVSLYIDRIAINDLLGLTALGVYGLAYKFAAITALVMAGFQGSLTPLIYKHYKEKETPRNLFKIFNIFSISALIVVFGSILFSKEIVILFTTELYYSASEYIPILIMASFFSNMYIFAPGLTIAKKTKSIAAIIILTASLNTILNYSFIPYFGVLGASISTLISALLSFLIYVKYSNKFYLIYYESKKLFIILLLVLTTGYLVVNVFDNINLFYILLKVVIFLTVSIFITLMLIDKKYLKKIKLKR